MQNTANRRRFTIVPRRRSNRWLAAIALLIWLVSMLAAATLSARRAAPELAAVRAERHQLQVAKQLLETEVNELRQRSANLGRAEEITRAANVELQRSLAEREEEMSQLRADVSFYERLVGVSGQRRGLTVHSIDFWPGDDGSWSYRVTLVQNLNRGKVSRGEMRLQLDGVQGGRLASLDWNSLKQQGKADNDPFEFRYFQQINGSVMLPEDFQPHRVRVTLHSEGRSQEQAFPWNQTSSKGANAGR